MRYLLIILFGLAIAAIGFSELKFDPWKNKPSSAKNSAELIRGLRGEQGLPKPSPFWGDLKARLGNWGKAETGKKKPGPEKPYALSETQPRDQLGYRDRRELGKLLEEFE